MPPPPLPPASRGSNAGTLIAAMLLLACIAALFLLMLIVLPFIAGIMVVPLLGLLAIFQYLIWGRWLARLQSEEQAREAQNQDGQRS